MTPDELAITRHIALSPFSPVFSCVQQFTEYYKLTLDRHTDWRLTPRIVGHIHGLPTSFGILQATNGILCYIILEGDKQIFTGHMMWFVPADTDINMFEAVGVVSKACESARAAKRQQLLKDYD